MRYYVETVYTAEDGKITTRWIGEYPSKFAAMIDAKQLARDAMDCQPYGSSSLAYSGTELTAVVSWK